MIQVPSDKEISWFIGVHEGDGTFVVKREKYVNFSVRMIDKDTISKISKIWNAGHICIVLPRTERDQIQYAWQLQAQEDVLNVCNLIFPHLTNVRAIQMYNNLTRVGKPIPYTTPVVLDKLMWLVGILEAEGCFTRNHTYDTVIKVHMTDEKTLYTISYIYKDLFDIDSKILGPYRSKDYTSPYADGHDKKAENCQPAYQLNICNRFDVAKIMQAVYPYMSIRKKVCIDKAFERYEQKDALHS